MRTVRSHGTPARAAARRARSGGQGLVEFVIMIPVVLLIVLGALDFGRAFLGWVVLNNAARVGANYAALHPDAWGDPAIQYQKDEYLALVDDARADAAIALAGCDGAAIPDPAFPSGIGLGGHVVVTLDCAFDPITPFIGEVLTGLGSGTIDVSAQSVFAIREGGVAVAPPSSPPTCLSTIGNVDISGMDVQFNDATAGGPNWWFWVVEGPTAYVSQNPAHTYTTPGVHTVTLDTKVNGVDCTQDRRDITVAPTPSPDPSASPGPSISPPPSAPPPTCEVPGLVGQRKNAAQGLWDDAGFTTTVTIVAGANPNANWEIEYQSLNSGNDVACNVTIEIGPDPLSTPNP